MPGFVWVFFYIFSLQMCIIDSFIAEYFTDSMEHVVEQYHQSVCGLTQVSIRAPIHWMIILAPLYSMCYKSGISRYYFCFVLFRFVDK